MRPQAWKLFPPLRRELDDLLKFTGRIAIALALATAVFLGPSHVSGAAPDSNGATAADHYHLGGHDTPERPSPAGHADEAHEGYRVMCAFLVGAGIDISHSYFLLAALTSSGELPTGRTPGHLKEPPRKT
jgi:hypothetical protein